VLGETSKLKRAARAETATFTFVPLGRYCLIDIRTGKNLPDTRGHTRTFTFRK
jgi:hypothetical protein